MVVAEILERNNTAPITINAEERVTGLARLLAERHIGAVIVVDATGHIRGIISERDIARGLDTYGTDIIDRQVGELMTSSVITCTPRHTVTEIMRLMTDNDIRHLPVCDGDQLTGVVSMRDLVKVRVADLEQENRTLRQLLTQLK